MTPREHALAELTQHCLNERMLFIARSLPPGQRYTLSPPLYFPTDEMIALQTQRIKVALTNLFVSEPQESEAAYQTFLDALASEAFTIVANDPRFRSVKIIHPAPPAPPAPPPPPALPTPVNITLGEGAIVLRVDRVELPSLPCPAEPAKDVSFERDSSGRITGARIEPEPQRKPVHVPVQPGIFT